MRRLLVLLAMLVATPALAADVLLYTLEVGPTRMHSGQPGWGPKLRFGLRGPFAEGKVTGTFKKGGAAWITLTRDVPATDEGEIEWVELAGLEDDQQTKETGTFPFEVSLGGKVLLDGQLVVAKAGNDYVPSVDWAYAVAAVGFDTSMGGGDAPGLTVDMWASGSASGATYRAALVQGEKQLAASDNSDEASVELRGQVLSAEGTSVATRVRVTFPKVKGWVKGTFDDEKTWTRLDKQPGVYEVQLYREGKLARRLKVEATASGRIAATGVVMEDSKRAWMLSPVEILDGDKGKGTAAAWWLTGFDPWKKPANLDGLYPKK